MSCIKDFSSLYLHKKEAIFRRHTACSIIIASPEGRADNQNSVQYCLMKPMCA